MNVLWLQSAGCGGCTMSLLCAESPGVFELLDGAGISFLWHPALSEATGHEVRSLLGQIESGAVSIDGQISRNIAMKSIPRNRSATKSILASDCSSA